MSESRDDQQANGTAPETNWLSPSGEHEVTRQGDRVIIKTSVNDFRVQILQTPPCRELVVHYPRRLRLIAEEGMTLDDEFLLHLVPSGNNDSHCEVHFAAPRVICSQASFPYSRRTPYLGLMSTESVHVNAGNWRIGSIGNAQSGPISLRVDSEDENCAIHSSIAVGSLTSKGEHAYDCQLVPDGRIRVRAGSATFQRELRRAAISGKGNIRMRDGLTESRVVLRGDLTVEGDVTDSALAVHGGLIVSGGVTSGERRLWCRDVVIEGSLATDGHVRSDVLSVAGDIDCDDRIIAGVVNCTGNVSAKTVQGETAIVIDGNAESDHMIVGERLRLGGSIAQNTWISWHPLQEHAELIIEQDGNLLKRINVQADYSVSIVPTLRLPSRIEIERLFVDSPHLHLDIAQPQSQRDVDENRSPTAVLGIEQRHYKPELRVSAGRVRFRLLDGYVRMRIRADAHALAVVDEAPTADNDLELRGEGQIALGSDRGSFGLTRVAVDGPLALKLNARIGKLIATQAGDWLNPPRSQIDERIARIEAPGDTVVEEAEGECVLNGLAGTIRSDAKNPLRVHRIWTSDSQAAEGQLVNVDVSQLPPEEIKHLRSLRVLEIEGRSLQRFADERSGLRNIPIRLVGRDTRRDQLTPEEIRTHSETAAELADIQSGKVNSGNSRAWLHWCVARLQHQGLEPRSWERFFRSVYRLVGYGYRPGPALATWAIAALTALAYAILVGPGEAPAESLVPTDGGSTDKDSIEFVWSLINHYFEFLLLPISRLLQLGGSEQILQLRPTSVDIAARVVIGIPFLFFLLSVRQFFRSPVGEKRA